MFCSFAAAPRILRFYCWGRVVEWDEKGEFDRLVGEMVGAGNKLVPGARAVVLLDVFKVSVDYASTDKRRFICGRHAHGHL